VPSNSAKIFRATAPAFPLRHGPQFNSNVLLADILFEAESLNVYCRASLNCRRPQARTMKCKGPE
jgi:hypothetical protein